MLVHAVGTDQPPYLADTHWPTASSLVVSQKYPLNGIESSGIFAAFNSIIVTISIHYLLFLFMTFALMLLKTNRSPPTVMGVDMLIGTSGFVNTWMSLLFVILQFFPQVLQFRSMSGSPGLLSLLSLGVRAVVMLAVSVRWFQRLGAPDFGDGNGRVSLTLWYRWGWLPFNYITEGISCALLVGWYVRAGWISVTLNIAGEETLVVP